jgi:hypothetical protein
MTGRSFEVVLRDALVAAAPVEIPAGLDERVRRIPLAVHAGPRFTARPSVMSILGAGAALALVVGTAALLAVRAPSSPGGGAPNPVTIASTFGSLEASDFALVIDGQRVPIPAPTDPAIQRIAFVGSQTFGQLTVMWRAGAKPYVLILHFAANARTWWVTDALATDGRAEGAGWLYLVGPFFETPIGQALNASSEVLPSTRSTLGEKASLRFGQLRLQAFVGMASRDPVIGPMPSSGVIGATGPDFISMVSGEQIVGYVSSRWHEDIPINSFRGQPPEQPVFGSDLRTLVGYSVPGGGFQPVSGP